MPRASGLRGPPEVENFFQPVGERKNQEKKLNIRTFEGVYFAYMGKEPPVRIDPIFGGRGPRRNHVIQIWWCSVKGQSLPFPIDFDGRPYNTLTTVWACDAF